MSKDGRNRAFSALILSLGLIAGLVATATPAAATVYYVTWDDNGATTASSHDGSNIAEINGGWVENNQVPSQMPTKIGYNFDGWFVASPDDIKCNADGDEIPKIFEDCNPTLSGSTFTFFAQWTPLLTALTASSGTSVPLSPTFASSTTSYTASVAYSVSTGFTVTPTKSDDVALDQYLGSTGTNVFMGDLSVGENIIRIVATGTDKRSQTYTVKVTRADISSDAKLSGLAISAGTLSPPCAVNTTSCSASVAFSSSSITVTPTSNEDNATITVNGTSVTSGSASGAVALDVGANTITVIVTAQNGTTNTYTITVTRGTDPSLSSDATLSQLDTWPYELSPTPYDSRTTSYTISVENVRSTLAVDPRTSNPGATYVTYLGPTGTTPYTGALSVGDNVVRTVVTAQDGTVKTYTVIITRAAASLSADASLSALAISTGTLSPTFGSGTLDYTVSVGNSTSSITVTPTRNQANATITVNGTSVTSGSASSAISLSVGSNTITVVVTAQNGTTTGTYTITVTRAAQAANTNTVTWNGQGATTASSGGSTTYTNGSSVSTIPTTAPQKSGHTFIGWFTGATNGVQVANGSFTPASPYVAVTFYAHWSVNRSSSVGTWAWTNQSSVGARKWHALATSADGSKLFAGVDDGGSLYRSTDFGITWSVIAGTSGKNWFSLASNIDGTKVAAVDRGGDIWTSTNSGSTWMQRSVGAVHNWESIASSSDGTKLVAVASNGDNNGFIYTSSNSGVTWSSNLAPGDDNSTNKFTGVASSNDGTYLAATTWADGIYTSSNSGQTWTARTLPVPVSGSTTYLQAVASSGDGSRLVTGSRTRAGGSNGGVIFTSADYGVTWKAFTKTDLDYINFTSNGDGSRLAAAIYGQAGVSTSADFGATWTFQSVGLSGEIPIASNIDGSLLFVGAYGGNLWTGKVPNARVVAVLPASTTASLAAGASTPATALSFSASSAAAAITVTPIANPATEAATPFSVAQASVFDISVVNVTGQVTVCVDGGPNVRLWHFTNGAWVDVTTSQTATQTCGVTSSFSPFATGPAATASLGATLTGAASDSGASQREAEKQSARTEIASTLQSAKDLTVESFAKAEIPGVTAKNLAAVQAEILALPEESRADISQVLKVARKFEVVGNIASNQVMRMTSTSFVEIGLIPASSKNKVALMAAIRKLPVSARDTYAEIKAAIDAETARIKSRNDRLAAIINRKTTKSTQK